jgi:hypothetical protein
MAFLTFETPLEQLDRLPKHSGSLYLNKFQASRRADGVFLRSFAAAAIIAKTLLASNEQARPSRKMDSFEIVRTFPDTPRIRGRNLWS